ncbi:MAG: S9 family peptidase [Desulfobacterales bacterium]|nr:S9 family peptidase [Desulfobacterales bacterium]
MKTREIPLQFSCDQLELQGILHLPHRENPPLVVGSHGLEGSLHSAKQEVLSRLLPRQGMAFLRFDHRGCGASQGNFVKDTSLEKRTRDFLAATQHALSLGLTSNELGIFGSSMGGATCINAWDELEKMDIQLKGAVLCASPVVSRTIENIPQGATDDRPALPLSFFKENLLFDLRDKASALHHLLIFHGDADEVVPVDNARILLNAAQSPKELICQSGGGHRMDIPAHQEEFEARAGAWFQELFNLTPGN